MPGITWKESVIAASQPLDRGLLTQIDTHELLTDPTTNESVTSFDEVRSMGEVFLRQRFDLALPSTSPRLPNGIRRSQGDSQPAFLAKLALGPNADSHFPATIEPVLNPAGSLVDLRIHIVPVHFGALEVAQFGPHTDSLLALAAAAAVAPGFILGLETGLTGDCSTHSNDDHHEQKTGLSGIQVDHGSPLAAIFESFQPDQSSVLDAVTQITRNPRITIAEAGHLHHLSGEKSARISSGAGSSKVAAGVRIRTLLRSELPRHVLYFIKSQTEAGELRPATLQESVLAGSTYNLGLMATALGVTAVVINDAEREKKMEKILTVSSSDMPLAEAVGKDPFALWKS